MRLNRQRFVERHILWQRPIHADFKRKRFFRQNLLHALRDDFIRHVKRIKVNNFAFHCYLSLIQGNGLSRKPENYLVPLPVGLQTSLTRTKLKYRKFALISIPFAKPAQPTGKTIS